MIEVSKAMEKRKFTDKKRKITRVVTLYSAAKELIVFLCSATMLFYRILLIFDAVNNNNFAIFDIHIIIGREFLSVVYAKLVSTM